MRSTRALVLSILVVATVSACTPVPPGSQGFTLTVQKVGSGTVTSTPPGIDCGATCAAPFDLGAVVTLTAVAGAGATFEGWSGDCSGASCTVTMLSNRSVTASFGDGNPTACTYGSETVEGNLNVDAGVTCTLNGTTVQGNVILANGAHLDATDVLVGGNVQALSGGSSAVVLDSTVGGDVQLMQGTSGDVRGNLIDGNLQFDANGGALVASGNTIGGDLQAFQNTGGVTIADNTIDGNLQCKGNVPAPTGGNNLVHGAKEDQCSGL